MAKEIIVHYIHYILWTNTAAKTFFFNIEYVLSLLINFFVTSVASTIYFCIPFLIFLSFFIFFILKMSSDSHFLSLIPYFSNYFLLSSLIVTLYLFKGNFSLIILFEDIFIACICLHSILKFFH